MFTAAERSRIRSEILDAAAQDHRISGAAITGSAAADREDRWSDIDLAFGVRDPSELPGLLEDWTSRMYRLYGAVHHVDVHAGAWVYRVFLLSSGLQVDLAFVASAEFRALAPTFRLIFGEAKEPVAFPSPSIPNLIGMAWLHALHARSSIARNRLWQAEYMIGGVRNHAFTLACIRHGLPAFHGRGTDDLPQPVTARFKESLITRLDAAEIGRAYEAAVAALLNEVGSVDAALAGRLEPAIRLDGGEPLEPSLF